MAGDDYSPAIGGGLKLKGSKPIGVKKKTKSKSKVPPSTFITATTSQRTSTSSPVPSTSALSAEPELATATTTAAAKEEEDLLWRQVEEREREQDYKTPTEKRHEVMRRKRLEDRLKREGGGRTHKQRVEELNRYLSGLSEHHDMPRIGPG